MKLVNLFFVLFTFITFSIYIISDVSATPSGKVYVCKYVGTPGVNETLQTGQNPIEVSINALSNGWSVGSYFNDQHGRSYVLATVPQVPAPSIDNCPQTSSSPTPTPTPVWTPTPTPFATYTPIATATATNNPCNDCNDPTATPVVTATPTATPTSTPVVTSTPTVTATPNNESSTTTSTNTDSGTGGGQVLGTSTMAATGTFEDSVFYSLFTLGSLLISLGIMKNGKKKAFIIN